MFIGLDMSERGIVASVDIYPPQNLCIVIDLMVAERASFYAS
jgi:hypothetical protein